MAKDYKETAAIKIIVGTLLKSQREDKGIMQKDIAEKLQIKNPNQVSMIESGRAGITKDTIISFLNQYHFTHQEMVAIVYKYLPEMWDFGFLCAKIIGHFKETEQIAIDKLEKTFEEMLVSHGLEHMLKLLHDS